MIVSLLQLMGFASAKPIQSRADEVKAKDYADTREKGITSATGLSELVPGQPRQHAAVRPARRQVVKAPARKTKLQAKVQKPAVKAKAPAKAAAKPSSAKAGKASASTKAGPTKTRAPVAAPVAAKKSKQAAATAKPGKPVAKSALKSATQAKPRSIPAPVVKTSAKPAVKPTVQNPKPAPAPVMIPAPPAKTRSARSAQLTAPSMAPAVASTAAKASYTSSSTSAPVNATQPVPPPHIVVKKDPKLANNWKTRAVSELTDADIMAMPDAEYMNEQQMAFFRLKLVQLKQDILNSADETTEHLREDTVIVPDPADRATIEEEHALELRTRDRERKLLKKIEQSINRIDAGDYGYCDETGEPIGVGRLLARPTATLSLEAQQRRELKQKMFGD
jgi:DnaK suppressor protein